MKTAIRILTGVFILAVLFAAPNRASAAGPSLVIVQWGDTLAAIAARYDTTVDALVRANALPNSKFIHPETPANGGGVRLQGAQGDGKSPASGGGSKPPPAHRAKRVYFCRATLDRSRVRA